MSSWMAPGTLDGKSKYGGSNAMIVVVKRDGVVCNMDFAPDTVAVAGKITMLNRTRAGNTYKMRES